METVVQDWVDQIVAFVPQIGLALLIFVAFWLGAKLLRRAVRLALASLGADRLEVIKLLANAAHASLVMFGLITALVASLGLAGFGLSFALRDAISNVLAGVIILMYRPFRIGDHISTGGHEGTVVSIDLRYTTIDSDDNRYLIPNSNLLSRPVILPRTAAVAA